MHLKCSASYTADPPGNPFVPLPLICQSTKQQPQIDVEAHVKKLKRNHLIISIKCDNNCKVFPYCLVINVRPILCQMHANHHC